jgi:hypothetical protein
MLHHFECPSTTPDIKGDWSLVFDWDDETGEVTGRDADHVLACFQEGSVPAHPIPWAWNLTSTKNKTDIAAVIGYDNLLPDVLKDFYPQIKNPFDGYIRDEAGKIIAQVCF